MMDAMPHWNDRYGRDPLAKKKAPKQYRTVEGTRGLMIEDAATEYCGAVVGFEKSDSGLLVRLEDRHGHVRVFPTKPGLLLLEGEPIHLIRPRQTPRGPQLSNSGSRLAAHPQRARTARASRIWVEGKHDALIVQQVWGHDLAQEGIVVEELSGLDNLPERLAYFSPSPQRRVGVLADHLITGTKETALVDNVGDNVLVTGHPFVDIWAAVKPATMGISAWPDIPMGEDWKTGTCQRLGWGTPQDGWRRIAARVKTYRDLDSTLIGAVERLIDFVTEPGAL